MLAFYSAFSEEAVGAMLQSPIRRTALECLVCLAGQIDRFEAEVTLGEPYVIKAGVQLA